VTDLQPWADWLGDTLREWQNAGEGEVILSEGAIAHLIAAIEVHT